MRERKGAWVSQKVLLNNVFESAQVEAAFSSCSAVGNLFKGKDHMKHHESNQKSGQRVQKFIEQVHEKASFLASQSQTTVFVGQWME